MKHIAIFSLAAIGALALALLALRFASHAAFPGYREVARRQFASPGTIAAISSLYAKVEAAKSDPSLQVVESSLITYPMIRRIPKSWLPEQFSDFWGGVLNHSSVEWGDVLAYYDERDVLVGIEFFGSRYGCFASRDSTRCPSWFHTLHRLSERPLYITTRISEDEE
jgi:hypothetical protein